MFDNLELCPRCAGSTCLVNIVPSKTVFEIIGREDEREEKIQRTPASAGGDVLL